MNKYMLILSDQSEVVLQELREAVLQDLNPISPTVLVILPHIVLFHHAGGLEQAAQSLKPHLSEHANWILIQIHRGFLGTVKLDRMIDLEKFFAS